MRLTDSGNGILLNNENILELEEMVVKLCKYTKSEMYTLKG